MWDTFRIVFGFLEWSQCGGYIFATFCLVDWDTDPEVFREKLGEVSFCVAAATVVTVI